MILTKTLTDRELELKINVATAKLAQMKLGTWSYEKQEEIVRYYKSQLAKPKEERLKYERGTL